MRKSQLNIKLGQELYYTAKQNIIKSNIIYKKFDDSKKQNDKVEDKGNFKQSDICSFANTI